MADDTFLHRPPVFWDSLSAMGTLLGTVVVVITAWLAYRQFKVMVKTTELQGIKYMQSLVRELSTCAGPLYQCFLPEMIARDDQFAIVPPSPHESNRGSGKLQPEPLTSQQLDFARMLIADPEFCRLARTTIGKLNDLGQLLEDGFLRRRVFMGKYHVMIIRLCYMLEPIRYVWNEDGNYGQRMLRLRHMAVEYNSCIPKHRVVDLTIRIGAPEQKVVLISGKPGSVLERLHWYFVRLLKYTFY